MFKDANEKRVSYDLESIADRLHVLSCRHLLVQGGEVVSYRVECSFGWVG